MQAVLFDFNGTLYNDTRFHQAAWKKYLKDRFGFDLPDDEVRRRCIGPGNELIFKDFFGEDISPELIRQYSKEKEVVYRSICRSDPENLKLMEGAAELFDLLVERGIPFVIATASPIENVEFYLDDLGMRRWCTIDRIVYEEGKLAGKPDPAFYLEAARRAGARPEDCIIVEDSPTGILAAERANAGRIIVIDRTTPMEQLTSNPNIHAIIHDFYGFEQYL
ncbi:MAG: HAD family phosphatase [Clostridia bacterium]|nr:HAD family phosphatase [Clostridia bacterium]